MVEVGTWSLPAKVHPDKKTAIKKNSTVLNREFDSLFNTVEIFDLRIFSLGELLRANSASEFNQGHSIKQIEFDEVRIWIFDDPAEQVRNFVQLNSLVS